MRIWLAALLAAGPAHAIELQSPVDCSSAGGCLIQNYVDRDSGPGAQDYTCGPMSYDGHTGVDFRVRTLAELDLGALAVAAAPGRVRALRDGEPDTGTKAFNPERACGNGVVLDHGDGWVTQYCHLAKGSIRVARGETVKAGAPLGEMGYSGNTAFPHVEFSLRKDGVIVDPFAPEPPQGAACGGGAPLWAADAGMDYRPGGILSAGMAASQPDLAGVRAGAFPAGARVDPEAEILTVWGWWYGLRKGDELAYRLSSPLGVVADQVEVMTRNRAEQFFFAGRRQAAGWPPGLYSFSVELRRGGAVIDSRIGAIRVRR